LPSCHLPAAASAAACSFCMSTLFMPTLLQTSPAGRWPTCLLLHPRLPVPVTMPMPAHTTSRWRATCQLLRLQLPAASA
jgi:hypothetical protein